ncbi:glycogen debranching N-terminal domain-containing protein [Streptomyces sp. FXJ1.4098]|nr:glycogen debranching N-terminal domain-containing protein [Streptomyces sp. FXJ1.4098]
MDTTVKPQDTNDSVTATTSVAADLQPFLHDAVVTLYAPSFVISRADGQLGGDADGFYHGDSRALSHLTVTAGPIALAPVGGGLRGADRADFRSILRGLGEVTPDPAVTLLRRRTVASGRLEESFEVTNAGTQRVRFRLTVTAATDLALMERVKSGHVLEPVRARVESDGHGLVWSRDGFSVRLTSEPAPDVLEAAEGRAAEGRLSYDIELAPAPRGRRGCAARRRTRTATSSRRPRRTPCRGAPRPCAARTAASTSGWTSRSPTRTGCA